MQVGNLVKSLKFGTHRLGIVVNWYFADSSPTPCPVVRWNDGKTSWVMPHLVKVLACK